MFEAITIIQSGIAQGTSSNPTHWQVIDVGHPDSTALTTRVQYWWRTKATDGVFESPWSNTQTFVASAEQTTGIEEAPSQVPQSFALQQNYPNPFNPATTIRFELPQATNVTLRVYNILGQEVITLLNREPRAAGFHAVRWNGRNNAGTHTASGIYFYRIEAGNFVAVRKMMLVK